MALTPFKPGQSGNPSGRPKMSEAHRKAFGEISDLGIKALRAILDGSDDTAKASDRVKAADIAFDRTWGKPLQQIDANVNDGSTIIDTSKLTPEQKAVLAEVALASLDPDEPNN